MANPASALVTASTQLLEDLASGRRPLSSVSGSLADLADQLGVQQVMVAIDDHHVRPPGVQLGRALLGDHGELLIGPRASRDRPTEPARRPPSAGSSSPAVAAAFERARANPASTAATTEMVTKGAQSGDLLRVCAPQPTGARGTAGGSHSSWSELDQADDRSGHQIETHLRASDTLVEIGPHEFGILLPGGR